MKISLNWIKDFVWVNPEIPSQELVETITLSVCEVEGFEETGGHLKDVLVSEVKTIEPHPDADKLSLVTVDHGSGTQKVVCGASNFKVGDKVPYAPEGAVLPGDFVIKKTKIRGVESCGMLCAEDELGFSDDHSGLMILDAETKPGENLASLFPDQVDVIMEIDNKSITHRPDLWGHYGFARELGAIYRQKVKPTVLQPESLVGTGKRITDVEVLAADLVPRFTGLSVDGVKITPSPSLIRHRLTRVGLRPINNMVDLTNYVMLELGQPMHAFDASLIAGNKLIVRRADEGTKVMTLHQKLAALNINDLTICDANGPSVVAGVVGGENTGVKDTTTAIFLEAANWDPVSIRKTSTRIGMRTDASSRFEKSLDPEMTLLSIQRAVEIMKLTNPSLKICGAPVDIINYQDKPLNIKISTDFICRRLGKKIDDSEIKEILISLGFTLQEKEGELDVEVPSYRKTKDISIPEDLVEEIGRIYGFNNIPPAAPSFPIEKPVFNLQHRFENLARNILSNNHYHEVVNYPLTCQKTEDQFGIQGKGIMKLVNPVADHQDQMRTSLLPHFVQTILNNQKIAIDFKLFELGRVYWKGTDGSVVEPNRLMMGLSRKSENLGGAFYRLKHDLLNLLSKLQIGDQSWKPLAETEIREYQHKYISAAIFSGNTMLGTIFVLSPQYVDKLGIREDVCFAELDFDKLYLQNKTDYLYQPAARFPAVHFELSIMVPERTYFESIRDIIYATDKLVSTVKFLDVYNSKEFKGHKSLSVSIEFRSAEKTLEPDEVKSLQDAVINRLAEKGYKLREASSE